MRASKIRVVIQDRYSLRMGIQGKNNPGGTHPRNSSRVCSKRDNDEGVYTSLISPPLCSVLVER